MSCWSVWNRKTGKPVFNAIVWQDRRTADYCDQLKREGHAEKIKEKTGKEIIAYAESRGYILRGETEKYGSDGWFRITIGTQEENRMAVDTVREFLTKK